MPQALNIVHDTDPRSELMKRMKPVASSVSVMGARVMVAVYKPAENAKVGSIFLPEKTKDEYRYQGTCGLVIGLGPIAFTHDDQHNWGSVTPKIGDWITFDVAETRARDTSCGQVRFLEDTEVIAIIDNPDRFY